MLGLQLGHYTLHAILDGTFALDGGAMFGVVPKTLWQKALPADAENRVSLALRTLLIVDERPGGRRILVDVGIGDLWSEKNRVIYKIARNGGLTARLAELGLCANDITDVVITHLHFDHVGGATARAADGNVRLTFPRATHHVQRRNWSWAHHPSERDCRSYLPETFSALEGSGKLHLVEGETELLPGVFLLPSEGHTVGAQLVRVVGSDASGTQTALVFCGDLIPTRAHLRAAWHMAYDLYPLTLLEEKRLLLAQALEERSILFFPHDPNIAACRARDVQGEAVLDEVVAL